MRRSLWVGLAAVASCASVCNSAANAAADFTTLLAPTGVGAERGVVQLKCVTEQGHWRFSRGAILDVGDADVAREIILTTAHGLLPTAEAIKRNCHVLGQHGYQYAIGEVWQSAGDGVGPSHDWAVLLTERRIRGDVGRLRIRVLVPSALPKLIAADVPVRLLRYAEVKQVDCRLLTAAELTNDDRAMGLMTYSCRSRPGLSGSPILIGLENEPTVIGLHLGWGLKQLGSAGIVGVGRVVDASVAEAINAAAERARENVRAQQQR